MTRGTKSKRESQPPTITVPQAVELLTRQIARADQVIALHYDNPQVEAWESQTENILSETFGSPNGEPHRNTNNFKTAHRGELHVNMTDDRLQLNHVLTQQLRKALLASFVEQLRDPAPPSATAGLDQYRFHPEVERCSGDLFRNGHYKQAALEAYIRVIEAVKAKTGLHLDGDDLMNQAFGAERRDPILRVNDLVTDAERDEQRGFMFLFKGIVGLRNFKAHSNSYFDDPFRAHEYLALSSLLLRILELS